MDDIRLTFNFDSCDLVESIKTWDIIDFIKALYVRLESDEGVELLGYLIDSQMDFGYSFEELIKEIKETEPVKNRN